MTYEKYLNPRAIALKPSGIRKFFDVVAEMKDAISLGVGEPDFATPWEVRDSAIKSIQKGCTQYTSNAGLKELREQICNYMEARFNLSYNPMDQVIVTIGASEAIDLTLRVLICEGDEILVPEPSYVSYSPCVTLCGGVAVPLKCRMENEFKLVSEDIEKAITSKTKAIILPYPNNPTGAIMEKHELEAIAKVIKKHDLIVISDEIYAELTYGKKHVSIATIEGMKERTVVINGFSKAFAMTGWRVGYVLGETEIIKQMLKVHQYVIMCAPSPSQYGAVSAIKTGFADDFSVVEEMRKTYDMRRRFMVKTFNDMGLECFTPYGAFYVFPCVRSLGMDGEEFATKLLNTKKVAVVPGGAFGDASKDFVRCSYAYSMKDLEKATERIAEFVNEIKQGK